VVPSKGHRHRHTQSAASPAAASSQIPQNPQNPQNPHYLNLQSQEQNSQSEMSDSYQSNPTTPPSTPRRNNQTNQNRPTKSVGFDNESNKKPRKDKNRPKNGMASPAATRRGRNTPPSIGFGMPSSAKPISTPTAYAGATFHASPAPSALPIPSFYSKSVPDSPGLRGLKLKDASTSECPTPPVQASNTPVHQKTVPQREESPLDIFFKADRAEKARAKSASSSQNAVAATGPFNPPSQSPVNSHTPPAPGSQGQAPYSKPSPSALFAMELDGDGTAASPIGPAFSTPYAQRINAARPQNPPKEAQAATDRSQALKAYLFSGHSLSSASPAASPAADNAAAQPPPQPATNHLFMNAQPQGRSPGYLQRSPHTRFPLSYDQKQTAHAPRQPGRNSGLRQEVTPTRTPTKTPDHNTGYSSSPIPSRTYGHPQISGANGFIRNDSTASPQRNPSEGRSSEIEGMEDSLRRILKMGPSSGASGPVGNLPAATVSVPNYIGGRDPPMNGMHNGVMGS
jgi:hypothetical protein